MAPNPRRSKDRRPPAVLRRVPDRSSLPEGTPSPRRYQWRRLAALVVVIGIGAALYLLQFWREQSRPGMRHFFKGMEEVAAGYPGRAEQEWLLGVREDPGEYRCYEQLGDYYTELLQPRKGAEYYAEAARRAPRNGSLYVRLAAALRKCQQPEQARAAARRAAELLPNDPDAVGLYGLLMAEARNRPAALAALRRAHQLRPGDRRYFITMVNTEMDTFDLAGAERDLTPYLRAHPRDPDACYLMAEIYNQKPRTAHNLRTAIEFAQRALALMPSDERAYNVLGQLYLDSDQVGEALKVYTAGLRVAPNSEGMLRGMASCYRLQGRSSQVAAISSRLQTVLTRHERIAQLTHVMSFNHHDTTAGLELARLSEEDGRYSQARAYYEQLVRQAPGDPRTRRALAGFYQRTGRPDKARLALQSQFVP